MTRRAKDALVGVGYIIVILALIALSLAIYNHAFTSYLNVDAQVPVAGDSMADGAPVMVRGIEIGEVHEITTDGHNVDLHLQLNPAKAKALPANLTVQLLPETLFGQSYVNMVLPQQPSGSLSSGQTLHQDSSPGTIALERVFTQLDTALTLVQPDKLAASLGALAEALRGRGKDLGEMVRLIDRYLGGLAPYIPQFTDDLHQLVSVARTYDDAAPNLLRGLAAFRNTNELLVRQRQNYVSLLAGLIHTGRSYGNFVGTSQNQIIGVAIDSRPSLELTRRYASEFPCIARALVDLVPRVNKAFGAGTKHPGARVLLRVTKPSKAYTHTPTVFHSSRGPSCPYVPATGLAQTALGGLTGIPGTTQKSSTATSTTAAVTGDGIGSVNSPAENHLIAELMGPQAGMTPSAYPRWGSLLIGPALRGAEVNLK